MTVALPPLSPSGPLAGLRVLEIPGRLSVRVAGALLADLGAEVFRLESHPEDEPADVPLLDLAALAIALDQSKTLAHSVDELKQAHAAAPFDVLFTSGETRTDCAPWAQMLGQDKAVWVHLSAFGQEGPYAGRPATELNLMAYGAIAAYVGDAAREPIAPPIMLAAYQGGVMAAISALASLRRPGLTRVDLAEADVLATNHVAGLYSLAALVGDVSRRAGPRKPNPYPFTVLPCKDGAVSLVCLQGRQWKKLLKIMGDPAWGSQPEFADRRVNGEKHVQELDRLVGAWLSQHTKAQLREIAVQHGIPFAAVQTIDDLLVDRQLASRGFMVERSHEGGKLKVPRPPFTLTELGSEGTQPPAAPAAAAPVPSAQALPLAGIRVLDLGWVLSGPLVAQTMGDLGADVIKIESKSKLDTSRVGVPLLDIDPAEDEDGLLPNLMPHFNNVNRGKRSLVLDIASEAGKTVLARLVAQADMVVENFGAGSLDRLGLSPEWFARIKPDLVMVRISICGQKGPDATLRGYAAQSTALGGLDALCAYRSEPPIGLVTLNLGDVSAALFASLAALAAVRRAQSCGRGVIVDTSMMESAAYHLGPLMVARQIDASARPAVHNEHVAFTPHGIYRTAGEDDWISIAVRCDGDWQMLHQVLKAPSWAKPLNASERRQHGAEIEDWIRAWAAARSAQSAFALLAEAGVPAAPVYAVEHLLEDAHALARMSIVKVDHHILGPLPIYGTPMRAEPPIATVRGRAPDLGEHSAEVLAELGLSHDELETLHAHGAFDGTDPRPQPA